jgi:hypothetical protein
MRSNRRDFRKIARMIVMAAIAIGFLLLVLKMENDAYNQCLEVMSHARCVKMLS